MVTSTEEYGRVEAAIKLVSSSLQVQVIVVSKPGHHIGCGLTGCQNCNGPTRHMEAQANCKNSTIAMIYDPAHITPQVLWWTYLHELGHIIQGRDDYMQDYTSDYARKMREIDAWQRAKEMAEVSPWRPTYEFEQWQAQCLATYGLW